MNAFTILGFLQEYPGIMSLVGKFPVLKPSTKELMVAFIKKAASCPDPEDFLVASLKKALESRGGTVPVAVEVIDTRNLPKRR